MLFRLYLLTISILSLTFSHAQCTYDKKNPSSVIKLTHDGNELHIVRLFKNKPDAPCKDTIRIAYGKYVSFTRKSTSYSALNIPIKIRPKIEKIEIPDMVEADVKNIGLFLGKRYEINRFFYNGVQSSHAFNWGVFVSPTAIKLTTENTDGKQDKLTQLALSTGLGLSYTYNKFSIMVIPAGMDIGLGSEMSDWVYNNKFWWGFGVGVDLGFFNLKE